MDTRIQVTLDGIYYDNHIPQFSMEFDGTLLCTGYLTESITYNIHQHLQPGDYKLQIKLLNKTDDDTKYIDNNFYDKALKVSKLVLNDINCDECLLHSTYITDDNRKFTGENYISWNGVWTLDISIPVFTYAHQKKNLGWIYNLK